MADTIFTKILSGEIPAHKIYEDSFVFALLDIAPLSPGHTLVIPKEPAPSMDQLSDNSAAALGRVLPRICRAVVEATGIEQYNILQNNGPLAHQAVFHLHFHIIPKPNETEGLEIGWPSKPIVHEEGAALAAKISALV